MTVEGLVGGVEDNAVAIGVAKTTPFFRGKKLLLDLSGERMIALRVRLRDQVCQVQGSGLAQFLRGVFRQSVSCQGR